MSFTVINPATAEPIREVPRASVADVDAAIARAVRAQRSWAALAPLARADGLRAFARVVEAHVEALALLEVRNSGHPISSARWEASHVAQVRVTTYLSIRARCVALLVSASVRRT